MGISKRYRVARLLSVLLVLGMLAFFAVSCKDTPAGPANGTVTVNLTNAGAHEGDYFMFGIYKEGTDPTDPMSVADAFGLADIISGTAQCTAVDGALNIVTFSGGGRYFISAFVDEPPGNGEPDTGEYACIGSVFTVDGNMTQTLDFSSFSQL